MSSLPCAKEIIDNLSRLSAVVTCTSSTVALRRKKASALTPEAAARWAALAEAAEELMGETLADLGMD